MSQESLNPIYVEAISKTFFELTQAESKKQGREFTEESYELIDENAKEYFRNMARYMMTKMLKMTDIIEFYADENNWASMQVKENGEGMSLKDGVIFDDYGEQARKLLRELGFIQ